LGVGEVADQEERLFGHDEGLIDDIDLLLLMLMLTLMLMPMEDNDKGDFLSIIWGGKGRSGGRMFVFSDVEHKKVTRDKFNDEVVSTSA